MDMIEIQFTKDECKAVAEFVGKMFTTCIKNDAADSMEWVANICSAWRALKAGANCGE